VTRAVVLLVAGLVGVGSASHRGAAQSPARDTLAADSSGLERFLARAREGTVRYRDRNAAIADGYRAVGPESPGMGQHWMNPALVLAGHLDPSRPQILNYITMGDGSTVLAGVAYAIPTRGTEAPVEPAGEASWHFHGNTVDAESFIPDHHRAMGGQGGETRVAVLHAWVWEPNPAGVLEPDNWALPYVRLGLLPPAGAGDDAARAVSLAGHGGSFFSRMLRNLSEPDSADTRAITEALAVRGRVVSEWLAGRGARPLDAAAGAWLESQWRQLWEDIQAGVSPQLWSRLQPARRSPDQGGP